MTLIPPKNTGPLENLQAQESQAQCSRKVVRRTPHAIRQRNNIFQLKGLAAVNTENHVRLSPGLKNCRWGRQHQQPKFATAGNPLGRSIDAKASESIQSLRFHNSTLTLDALR